MGLSTPGAVKVAAKYYISICCQDNNGIFHQAFGHAVQAGWNQPKPDESSCSACDKIGIAWLVASLLLWTSTREVV